MAVNKRVAIHTLGCKLNFAESSSILNKFRQRQYEIVSFDDDADIYVIHSCTVTATADKKTRQLINKVKNANPKAKIALIGCMVDNLSQNSSILEKTDWALGNKEKMFLPEIIENEAINDSIFNSRFIPAFSTYDRTRSFLKIQDGCDYFCEYCTIPYVRGRSRSAEIKDILNQLDFLVDKGIKEVIFTGINIGDYGVNQNFSFADLLYTISKQSYPLRFRISSIEPNLLSDEIIELVASSDAFMPHFHIPLQHGSDRILQSMKRRYTIDYFVKLIYKIKKSIPDAFIANDVIVGFPDETDEDFRNMFDLLKDLPIAYLHVFPYSDRPLANSFNFKNKIPANIKKQRSKILTKLSKEKQENFYNSFLNTISKVLWEAKIEDDFIYGYTENYIRVATHYDANLINKISNVLLEKLDKNIIIAKILNDEK